MVKNPLRDVKVPKVEEIIGLFGKVVTEDLPIFTKLVTEKMVAH